MVGQCRPISDAVKPEHGGLPGSSQRAAGGDELIVPQIVSRANIPRNRCCVS